MHYNWIQVSYLWASSAIRGLLPLLSPPLPVSTQTYGYPYLFALNNLESVSLLKKREKAWVGAGDTGSPWPALRRALRLVNDSVDVHNPDDIAFVSSG